MQVVVESRLSMANTLARSSVLFVLVAAVGGCGASPTDEGDDTAAAGAATTPLPEGTMAPTDVEQPVATAPQVTEGPGAQPAETGGAPLPTMPGTGPGPSGTTPSLDTVETPPGPVNPLPPGSQSDPSDPMVPPPTGSEPGPMEPVQQPAVDCDITIDSHDVSAQVPTVGVVTWSSTAAIESANIEFGPAGGELGMSAPVDLDEPGYKTLLLGMKGSSDYDFQIKATVDGQTCTSERQTLTTGPVANNVPVIRRDVMDAAAVSPGFIVTMAYGQGGNVPSFIFDEDGDPVWWGPTPASASAARLSWDSKYVWAVTGNPNAGGQGEVIRISVETGQSQSVPGTGASHHDLAPLPDGNVAVLMHGSGCSEVAEITPDLGITTTIDLSTAYSGGNCHANAILYHPEDETFTISDRTHNLFVKVDRAGGTLHWQFGGSNPLGPHIPGSWNVNHGHQVLENGNFLFFNNNGMGGGGGGFGFSGGSPVHEFSMDEGALSAELVFSYTSASGEQSSSLGDVQRLPNGNTLVTYSNQGIFHEVNSSGDLVQVITSSQPVGYAMHRVSLYGEPPK